MFLTADDAPWSTYRGNNRRTGNTDNVTGPEKPKVLWFIRSAEHYATAPVPCGTDILFPGARRVHNGVVNCFPMTPKDVKAIKPTWTKGPPLIRLPTVSSPAIADGKVIFGDGMHQTDGAVLYCLPADGGNLLWTLQAPGKLVHMEGSPSVSNGRVYLGGGAAGVMCVELNTVVLDGKELSVKEIPALQVWALEEVAGEVRGREEEGPRLRYPADGKRSAQAVAEGGLDAGQGAGTWMRRCSSPATRCSWRRRFSTRRRKATRRVLSRRGDRQGILENAVDVQSLGRAVLAGDTVIVTTSTIPYDPKEIEGSKGEVVAIDLATGKEKWKSRRPAA